MTPTKLYETDNADLATFMLYQGIQFLGCRIDRNRVTSKPVAIMQFNDLKENARDLERMYYASQEKRFRDLNKYMLKEIHKALRDFSKAILGDEDV